MIPWRKTFDIPWRVLAEANALRAENDCDGVGVFLAREALVNHEPRKKDWRVQLETTLVSDLPAAYPGGPSHKAGATITLGTQVEVEGDLPISFITPSTAALDFSIAARRSTQCGDASSSPYFSLRYGNVARQLNRRDEGQGFNSGGDMRYVGVDGCKAGWLAVWRQEDRFVHRVFTTIDELVAAFPRAERILIDIPIGLPSRQMPTRPCDRLAREALGTPRQSSVFAPPCREALRASTLAEARQANIAETGKSLSEQAWGIAPKIAEVDQFLTDRGGNTSVREVHPELCFWALSGESAMVHAKDTKQGLQERREKLERVEPQMTAFIEQVLAETSRREVAADDVLDACVAFVTAEARKGKLACLFGEPTIDSKGLPLEMLYLDVVNYPQFSDEAQPPADLEAGRPPTEIRRGRNHVLHHEVGVMRTREHKVSNRNGNQVMMAGLKLQKDMGYCRGATVIVSDPTPQSPHAAWQFVVSNDEHATLVSRDTPPPGWIQPGVMVRIEVRPPRGQVSEPALRESPNQLKSPETRNASATDLAEVRPAPIKPRQLNTAKPPSSPTAGPLSSTDLGDMRRALIQILNKIEGTTSASSAESLGARIGRLARSERVPREVVPWMKTVTEMRNKTEYEDRVLTLIESEAVSAAWRAIVAWAGKAGH